MNARPAGLYDPAKPVTIADPYSKTAQRAEADRLAQRAPLSVEYAQAASDRDLAAYRLQIELGREARNRGRVPVALGVRS